MQRRVPPRRGVRAADARRPVRCCSGLNKLWIKFFLLAVFATMYVRDHMRPGIPQGARRRPDRLRLRRCSASRSEISQAGLPAHARPRQSALSAPVSSGCWRISEAHARTRKAKGGSGRNAEAAGARRGGGALTFARLFLLPAKPNALPRASPPGTGLVEHGRRSLSDSPSPALYAMFVWWFSTGHRSSISTGCRGGPSAGACCGAHGAGGVALGACRQQRGPVRRRRLSRLHLRPRASGAGTEIELLAWASSPARAASPVPAGCCRLASLSAHAVQAILYHELAIAVAGARDRGG